MNARTPATLFAAVVSYGILTMPSLAQHDHPDVHDVHEHAAAKPAEGFAAALDEIGERMTKLESLLANGDLDAAHDESDAIGVLAKSLGALALKPDSGIAREKVKDVNKAGKALFQASDGVHEAGEKKDLVAAKAAFSLMKAQADLLTVFRPSGATPLATPGADRYACPMHDEGDKTYDKPGRCPVCGMTLKKQTAELFSVVVTNPGGKVSAGEPATLSIALKDPAGKPVTALETVHEKVLHLLIVSNDLSWFTHEHPTARPDGTFSLNFTFPRGGEYTLYHDFSPLGVGQQVVQAPISVEGPKPTDVTLTPDDTAPKNIDGYTVSLGLTGEGTGPVKTGADTHLLFTISKEGKPGTTLAPYLGAMGHLVVISADRAEFVHSHPHETAGATTGGPRVEFEAHFRKPGVYKAWGQFNVGTREKERVITVPFTFLVAQGTGSSEPTPHSHSGGAHDGHTK